MRRSILLALALTASTLFLVVATSNNNTPLFPTVERVEATTTAPLPTASFTAQKGTSGWVNMLTVSPGDQVSYKWSTQNANTASSTITVNQADSCPSGVFAGIAKSVGGQANLQVKDCQAGRTYTLSYQALQQPGNRPSPPAVVVLKVNPLPVPTGTLTVQNLTRRGAAGANTEANVSDTLVYKWSADSASAASSTVSVDRVDACRPGDQRTAFPWVAATARGQVNARVTECQAGRTYTVSFTPVRKETGQAGSPSTVTVRVNPLPDPIAYLYGKTVGTNTTSTTLTVNPGSSINYTWLTANADTASSTVTVDRPDTCRASDTRTTFPWVAASVRGQVTAKVTECQAGRTYTIRLTASRKITGQTSAPAIMTVQVNEMPAPTASLTVRKMGDQTTSTVITVKPGDTLMYEWRSTNAALASSTVTVDRPDTCRASDTRTAFPWVANTLRGQLSAKVQSCQSGRTYHIEYQTSRANGGIKSNAAVVNVTVETLQPIGQMSASPTSCIVPSGKQSCTTHLTWSTQNTDQAHVFWKKGAAAEQDLGGGPNGKSCSGQSCPAEITADTTNTFCLYTWVNGGKGEIINTAANQPACVTVRGQAAH